MGDRTASRYGDDPVLTRATRRAVVSVVGAVALLVVGLSAVVALIPLKFGTFAFKAVGATHGWILLLPLAIAVLWLVREVRRSTRGHALGTSESADVGPDHPLRISLSRLAALADVPTPPLRVVASKRPNSYVVVEPDGTETVCVTTAALEMCTQAELDAMLAHELFHVAHGDARLTSRLEAIAELADRKVSLLSGLIVPNPRVTRSTIAWRSTAAWEAFLMSALLNGAVDPSMPITNAGPKGLCVTVATSELWNGSSESNVVGSEMSASPLRIASLRVAGSRMTWPVTASR